MSLYDTDSALSEAMIALEGRVEDGLVAMEAQITDLGLPGHVGEWPGD